MRPSPPLVQHVIASFPSKCIACARKCKCMSSVFHFVLSFTPWESLLRACRMQQDFDIYPERTTALSLCNGLHYNLVSRLPCARIYFRQPWWWRLYVTTTSLDVAHNMTTSRLDLCPPRLCPFSSLPSASPLPCRSLDLDRIGIPSRMQPAHHVGHGIKRSVGLITWRHRGLDDGIPCHTWHQRQLDAVSDIKAWELNSRQTALLASKPQRLASLIHFHCQKYFFNAGELCHAT